MNSLTSYNSFKKYVNKKMKTVVKIDLGDLDL